MLAMFGIRHSEKQNRAETTQKLSAEEKSQRNIVCSKFNAEDQKAASTLRRSSRARQIL